MLILNVYTNLTLCLSIGRDKQLIAITMTTGTPALSLNLNFNRLF